jgi:hypothetical protein
MDLKRISALADQSWVEASRLPVKAGPVPDRLTIWPVDDGRYGLDATFQGASGYERADHHRQELSRQQVPTASGKSSTTAGRSGSALSEL